MGRTSTPSFWNRSSSVTIWSWLPFVSWSSDSRSLKPMTISFSHAPSGLRSTADVPEHGSDVIVLPETVNEGQGIYRSDLDSLVKLLRSDGIDASYGHPAEQRSWRVIKGEAPLDIAIAVASSFVASGAWDLLVYSLGKWLTPYKDAPIHVDFANRVTLSFQPRDDGTHLLAGSAPGRGEVEKLATRCGIH